VYAVGDSELEVWAANRQLPALESALKRTAKIIAHHLKEPEVAPKARPRVTRLPIAAAEIKPGRRNTAA
jgi:hypothetical protein